MKSNRLDEPPEHLETLGHPLVSVILPTYNMAEYVVESVESILHQTLQDFELIIINDGSTDDTKTKLGCLLDHPKIVYRVQENQGVAAALSGGIRIAGGEFIAIQNADDISLPTRLAEQAAVLAQNPEAEMVFCRALLTFDDGRPERVRGGLPPGLSAEESFYRLYRHGNVLPYAVMFRRRHLRNEDPFPDRYRICCDYYHHLMVAHDYPILGIGKPLIRMRRGEFHDCLTRDHERTFGEDRAVLNEIHLEFRDKPPRVNRKCYAQAMANRFLAEARFYMKRGQYEIASRKIFEAFSYRPFSPRISRMFFKWLFRRIFAEIKLERSTGPCA
jgi:glycosyltransferase involved in cell wall biosynthesis